MLVLLLRPWVVEVLLLSLFSDGILGRILELFSGTLLLFIMFVILGIVVVGLLVLVPLHE